MHTNGRAMDSTCDRRCAHTGKTSKVHQLLGTEVGRLSKVTDLGDVVPFLELRDSAGATPILAILVAVRSAAAGAPQLGLGGAQPRRHGLVVGRGRRRSQRQSLLQHAQGHLNDVVLEDALAVLGATGIDHSRGAERALRARRCWSVARRCALPSTACSSACRWRSQTICWARVWKNGSAIGLMVSC
mgnify:CR=1 FL=1